MVSRLTKLTDWITIVQRTGGGSNGELDQSPVVATR